MTLAEAPFILMLIGLITYAVLGGADFGAAFWQLSARGEHGAPLREHAYRAMGPVWEANHVWLVFVLVVFWTAYPATFASVFSTLTVPLFIAALGIILRGTAYAVHAGTVREIERRAVDGLFSISSILTPFALGTVVGAVASGRVPLGNARGDLVTSWLNPSSILTGILAVSTGAYVAAVYLAADARRASLTEVCAGFRARALASGVATGAIACAALAVIVSDAGRVGERLLDWPALTAVVTSAFAGLVALAFVRRARFEGARYAASVAVGSVVVGWALAQWPELLPGLTIEQAAAGRQALIATVVGVTLGALILIPSLALLFGLVLSGRFDNGAEPPVTLEARRLAPVPRLSLFRVAFALGTSGAALAVIFDGGPLLAAGIVGLLAFVGLGAVALITHVAADDHPGRPTRGAPNP